MANNGFHSKVNWKYGSTPFHIPKEGCVFWGEKGIGLLSVCA